MRTVSFTGFIADLRMVDSSGTTPAISMLGWCGRCTGVCARRPQRKLAFLLPRLAPKAIHIFCNQGN